MSSVNNFDEQRALAESRRKALLDYNTNMEGAWEEGKAEGKLDMLPCIAH